MLEPEWHGYREYDEVEEHIRPGVGEEGRHESVCVVRAESVSRSGISCQSHIPESVDWNADVGEL